MEETKCECAGRRLLLIGVEFELYHPQDFRVTINSSDFVRVRSSPELIRQIENICGPGSVHVLN